MVRGGGRKIMKLIILLAMAGMAVGQPCVSHAPPFTDADSRLWICDGGKPWIASAAFLASSQLTDTLSSRGLYEKNPILGRGPFGTRQETIKAGAIAAVLLTEWSLRKHPALRRGFMWANYLSGGVTFAVAAHNFSER